METIKEKKKAEYETIGQLMKSLIERGWLPRGDKEIVRAVYDIRHKMIGLYEDDGKEYFELVYKKSLRELVSTDSGLWQFVCENGMINVNETEVYYFWLKRKGTLDRGHYYLSEAGGDIRTNNYEYRLIETSLKNEDELEQFLLDNIIINEQA